MTLIKTEIILIVINKFNADENRSLKLYSASAHFTVRYTEKLRNPNSKQLRLKVGFHYPSSRAEFTGRVDGPRTRVHFLTPVNSGRELG